MNKDKVCPKCDTVNFRIAAKCSDCGHVFFVKGKGKGRKKRAAAPPADDPSFSAGLTMEGGLMVFWYGRSEFTKFTPQETQLIRAALAPKAVRDYSNDVPTYMPLLLPALPKD